jgi:hypothetical protein
MIELAPGFEHPRQKLDKVVTWIEARFTKIDGPKKQTLIDYVNTWYNLRVAEAGLVEKPGDQTLETSKAHSAYELTELESELLGHGLKAEVEEIKRKVEEDGLI